jgi:hypothetical protein
MVDDRAIEVIANRSWIIGDQIHLIRVEPSIASINDPGKYEYYAGNHGGRPVWNRRIADLRPLIEWDDPAGCVMTTYNAPVRRYLMCLTDGGNTISRFNTYILESETVTRPWKLVVFMKNFGEQAYFVNFPSKFIGQGGEQMWLLYAANFTRSPDAHLLFTRIADSEAKSAWLPSKCRC